MSKQKLVKISDIIVDKELYPRAHPDFVTRSKYINAMKAGAVFPPISVAEMDDGRTLLIDGLHRTEAATACKETHIQAVVETGLTEEQVYREAVIANAAHGKPFTTQEVTQIAITMQDMNMSLQEISDIIRIPATDIQRFVAKRIARSGAQSFAIKKPLANVLAGLPVSPQQNVPIKQHRLNGRTQLNTVDMLIYIFKQGWIEDSETLRKKLLKLHTYIEDHLENYGFKFDGEVKKPKKSKTKKSK